MTPPPPNSESRSQPRVCLVGAGVVGRSIAQAHLQAGVSFTIADQDEKALRQAVREMSFDDNAWRVSPVNHLSPCLPAIQVVSHVDAYHSAAPVVIESIAERLDVKKDFFASAERIFGDDAILCSNTSTLRISSIAEHLRLPERFCGMHFFMPVDQRHAVEVIRGEKTASDTIHLCSEHARQIAKTPLAVGDGPGFVVNRLLSPYLNEAMLLLCRGVAAEQIERAALAYGMPMSPLELIDYIGTRTMFDAGRVFWQAFPDRLSPSPMLSGMIKRKRYGRACGAGFYEYPRGQRSKELADATKQICEAYRHQEQTFRDDQIVELLSIPMWIEAALARRDRIASEVEHLNIAMQGGLGYDPQRKWMDFYDQMGSQRILAAMQRWSSITASMTAPADLIEALRQAPPRQAMESFAG